MIRIYDIDESFGFAEELRDMLPRLPQWRRQKALSYRRDIDRFLCAKSFLMLEDMLREGFGLEKCPEFSFGSCGKPFFRDFPDIHFNISHCRRGIACMADTGPVGVDIEEIHYHEDLADVVLSPVELSIVLASDERDVKFTELWTLKESFLKLTGEGLRDDMRDILSGTSGISFTTEVRRDSGYVCSTASQA